MKILPTKITMKYVEFGNFRVLEDVVYVYNFV